MRMHRSIHPLSGGVLTLLTLVAVLTGCSSEDLEVDPGAGSADPGVTSSPAAVPSSGAASPTTPPPAEGSPPALREVPPADVQLLPAVPVDEPAPFGNGVAARVESVVPITTSGTGPGESSGEQADALTIVLDNGTDAPLDLGGVTVDLSSGAEAAPARPSNSEPARPFSGVLAPGSSAEGVYVFVVPPDQRGDVVVTVNYAADQPTVAFAGSLE